MSDYYSLSMYVNKKPNLVSDEFLSYFFPPGIWDLGNRGIETYWKIGTYFIYSFVFLSKKTNKQNCMNNEK